MTAERVNPPFLSSPRTRGGGFTFEVQHFGEGLGRGLEVKAFPRGVVIGADQGLKTFVREGGEIGLARHEAAHSADGVFDAALLPRRIGVAEIGIDGEPVQCAMTGELGAVSKVTVLRSAGGRGRNRLTRCRAIRLAALLGGLVASSRRDLRSCTVRIAWPYLENIMRSASQCPQALRSTAAGGRFATETRPSMKLAELPPLLPRQPRLLLPRGR